MKSIEFPFRPDPIEKRKKSIKIKIKKEKEKKPLAFDGWAYLCICCGSTKGGVEAIFCGTYKEGGNSDSIGLRQVS